MQWFRWHHGTVADPKFRTLARKAGQPVHVVLAVWAAVLEYASDNDPRGSIAGMEVEDIASCLDLDEEIVSAVLNAMQSKVLDGETLSGWDRRQPKREDSSAERVRAHRKRQEQQGNEPELDVTQCNAPDKNRTDKIRTDFKTTHTPGASAPISEDWELSDEDRQAAKLAGVDPDAESRKFRDYWLGKGETRADWSAQWRRWLSTAVEQSKTSRPAKPKKPTAQHDPPGVAGQHQPTEAEWRTATRKFKASGFWLNSYGPRPDMQSTRVPKHIRQEFGL